MTPITVTWRRYRARCRPAPPPADAHRRRQLAALIDRYGVTDARPATAVDAEVLPTQGVDGRPRIEGEVLI